MKKDKQTSPEKKLRQIEKRLVEILTSMGYLKGRSQKMAEITAYIAIRKEVTQKLLRELTGYSLGTVSSTLQSLEKQGFIRKNKSSSSREFIYMDERAFTESRSKSVKNIFEYFSHLQKFLTDIESRLKQPHLKGQRGYENVKGFVQSMNFLFPAVEQALRSIVDSSKIQKGADNK